MFRTTACFVFIFIPDFTLSSGSLPLTSLVPLLQATSKELGACLQDVKITEGTRRLQQSCLRAWFADPSLCPRRRDSTVELSRVGGGY